METIQRVAARRWGSLILALGLAVLSIPFAAISIRAVSEFTTSYPEGYVAPIGWEAAIAMATAAVLLAAVVAGTVAGFVVRRRPVGGLILALFLAWPVAIASLPLLPAVFGIPYQGVWFCFDSCAPLISSSPLSAATNYVLAVWIGVIGPIEIAAILAGLGYWASRRRHRTASAVLGMAAWVAFNAWIIVFPTSKTVPGTLPAAIALLVGCAIWASAYMPAAAPAMESPDPSPAVS